MIKTKVIDFLNEHPSIKLVIKRLYQRIMVLFSKTFLFEGNLEIVNQNDEYEYFFGYYDKSPWSYDERFLVCHRAKYPIGKNEAPKQPAEIVLFDMQKNKMMSVIGKTHAWNIQQGAMLQWVNDSYTIQYNDFIEEKFVTIRLDVMSNDVETHTTPTYSLSSKGNFCISLDFSRLHELRPGYGYSNIDFVLTDQNRDRGYCIWYYNFDNRKSIPLIQFEDLINLCPTKSMENATHKVNHIMMSPDDTSFMFIHRWINGKKKISRLLRYNLKTKQITILLDNQMVSHCNWISENEIIAYAKRSDDTNGYLLLDVNNFNQTQIWDNLRNDGHPSYCRKRRFFVTDTYPNSKRISSLYLIDNEHPTFLARVFAPFRYDNNYRCDLHPRISPSCTKVCIDSSHSGRRGVYIVDLGEKMI